MTDFRSPGYYPDPEGTDRERWWNGQGWSDSYREEEEDGASYPPPLPPPPPRWPSGPPAPSSISPTLGDNTSVTLPGGFIVRGDRKGWHPKTVRQALIIPAICVVVICAFELLVLDAPILALVTLALGSLQAFVWVRRARSAPEPEASISLEQIIAATQIQAPASQQAGSVVVPGEVSDRVGRGIRNAVIAFFSTAAITLVGVAMITLANWLGGEPSPDGGISTTGGAAFVVFLGILVGAMGFLIPIPAAIIAFIVTVRRR